MRKFFISLALLFSLSFLNATAFTQIAKSRITTFQGIIVDSSNAGIPKASVLIEGSKKNWALESDDKGKFKIKLPFDIYKFTIEKEHFIGYFRTDFRIATGRKITHKFKMTPSECSDCVDFIPPDNPQK
jgi:hypothetical protein